MASMDVFNADAFNTVSLTRALERVPYQPALLGQLNIFEPVPSRTETVAVEKRDGKFALINTSNRGAPLEERETEKRDIRDFRTRRIAKGDTITASEIQNIRAFGEETELMQVQAEVARRFSGPTGILRDIELTKENMRLGAVQGIVLDADGSVLDNWYNNWGVAQPGEIDFALGTPTTNVRGKCMEVRRAMRKAARGSWIDGVTEVHALCGDAFFDGLIDHDHVRQTYLNWEAAADLRQALDYEAFRFGNIFFHNYRGTDDYDKTATKGTALVGVDPDKAKFFPVNAPGVFQAAYSPAEFFDFVNTPGQELYGMIVRDKDRNAWVRPEAYAYPLFMCTNPAMLQRAKRA